MKEQIIQKPFIVNVLKRHPIVFKSIFFLLMGIILFAILEIAVGMLFPQFLELTKLNGLSVGQKDPLIGHTLTPSAHVIARGPEFSVEYIINEDGFRDETNHLTPNNNGSTHILVIGDSFTFGDGNNYEDIWPTLIEDGLREMGYNVNVVNAGVPAYNTNQELLYLKRIGDKYKPDIIIMAFTPNDLFMNSQIVESEIYSRDKRDEYKHTVVRSSMDKASKFHISKSSKFHLGIIARRFLLSNDRLYTKIYMATGRQEYFSDPVTERFRHQVEITETLFSEAYRYSRMIGAEMAILSIPQQFQVLMKGQENDTEGTNVDIIDETFKALCEEKDIPWIETLSALAEEYRNDNESLYFRLDGHLNQKGNRIVARRITDAITIRYEAKLKRQKVE